MLDLRVQMYCHYVTISIINRNKNKMDIHGKLKRVLFQPFERNEQDRFLDFIHLYISLCTEIKIELGRINLGQNRGQAC